ncbi:MAG: ABC transporter permease subunit [Myxococcota bacterium]|nr:ABC transporter permease subunit [Myxococcota bacterium]
MAIHEQNYVRYEGELVDRGAALNIAWTSFRVFLSFTRTKLLLLALWLLPIGGIIAVFIEYSVRNSQLGAMADAAGSAPGGGPMAVFIQMQIFSLAILYASSGCGVISDDLRYRTFQLYFSKPLEKYEYALGKFGGLFLLGSLVTLLPALFVGGLRLAFYARTDFVGELMLQSLSGLGILTGGTLVMSAMLMGLSSLTAHTRYVVLSWLGVIMVPILLSIIVSIAAEGTDAANLWSMTGNLWLVSQKLLTEDEVTVPLIAPLAILLGLGGAGVGMLARRIARLEGVA